MSLNTLPEDNKADRQVVLLTYISSHITPVLEYLHWLPVRQRIMFKVLVFIYKALHAVAPKYLAHMLHSRTHNPRLQQLYNFVLILLTFLMCMHSLIV